MKTPTKLWSFRKEFGTLAHLSFFVRLLASPAPTASLLTLLNKKRATCSFGNNNPANKMIRRNFGESRTPLIMAQFSDSYFLSVKEECDDLPSV